MDMDTAYHYPPELLDLLVDTIPRLTRSKPGVLDFFRGAGVKERQLADLRQQVARDRDSVSKFTIARKILTQINEGGDSTLRERREVIKRVVEFEDFSLCWENERLAAIGLVARVRGLVNAKDTVTKIKDAFDAERQKRMAEADLRIQDKQKKESILDQARQDFYRLFGETDPNKRGRLLEKVMKELFEASGIAIRESFTVIDPEEGKVIEQVDGLVEFNHRLFLTEIKWLSANLDKPDAAAHLVRVYHRPETHGLFISATPFTNGALKLCAEALLKERLIVLCTLQEIFRVLDARGDLCSFLRAKIEAVVAQKTPFPQVDIP